MLASDFLRPAHRLGERAPAMQFLDFVLPAQRVHHLVEVPQSFQKAEPVAIGVDQAQVGHHGQWVGHGDDAARQVRNCFIDNTKCNTDSSDPWNALVNNAGSTATSISPDRTVGAGVHAPGAPTGGAVQPATGPWSGAGAEVPIQWNAAGNTYGCWF